MKLAGERRFRVESIQKHAEFRHRGRHLNPFFESATETQREVIALIYADPRGPPGVDRRCVIGW